MSANIRNLRPADLSGVVAISEVSFPERWKAEEFQFLLDHPAGFCVGLFSKEETQLYSYFFGLLVMGDMDVVTLASHPEHRGQGHATALLDWIAKHSDVSQIFLEVATTNTAAITLYKKLGFEITGLRPKYYQGKTDARLMRWGR